MTAVLLYCLVLLPLLLTGWSVRPLDASLALDWPRPCPWLVAFKSESCKAVDCTGEVESNVVQHVRGSLLSETVVQQDRETASG